MSDKPPHFMHAHRTRRQRRAAAPLFLRRAAAPLLGVAVAATLLFAPVFHGVSQAAYFTEAEGLFNHVQLIGSSRDGQPPQLVPAPHRANPSATQLRGRIEALMRASTLFLSGSPGRGAVEIFLAGILQGRVVLRGSGGNAQFRCSTCTDATGSISVYDSPVDGSFFAVVPDRLDVTQTVVGNNRRVTFTIVSIDTGGRDALGGGLLRATPVRDDPTVASFTVYVDGTQATLSDFALARQEAGPAPAGDPDGGVIDPISGLNADIVSASVTIANSADQPTSVTFMTSVRHMGGSVGRTQINPNGHGAQRTVTFAAQQAPEPPPAMGTVTAVSAGADQRNVLEGGTVTLGGRVSGSGSLTYTWAQVAAGTPGAAVVTVNPIPLLTGGGSNSLSGSGAAEATFTAPPQTRHANHGAEVSSAEYHFRLTGSDGSASISDTVTIHVIDGSPPVVWAASTDQSVVEGASASLRGNLLLNAPVGARARWTQIVGPGIDSAETPQDDPNFFLFTSPISLAAPADPANARSFNQSVSTPEQDAGVQTTYYLRLDGTRDDNPSTRSSIVASVTVRDADGTPTANAGADQTVNTGATVTLDASASADARGITGSGANLTYAWSQTASLSVDTAPQTNVVTLSDAAAAASTFSAPSSAGDLFFKLTVTDTITGNSSDARVTVTVQAATPPPTSPPTVMVRALSPNGPDVNEVLVNLENPEADPTATRRYTVTFFRIENSSFPDFPGDFMYITADASTNAAGSTSGLSYSWTRVQSPDDLRSAPANRNSRPLPTCNARSCPGIRDYWAVLSDLPDGTADLPDLGGSDASAWMEVGRGEERNVHHFLLQVTETASGLMHDAIVTLRFRQPPALRTLVLAQPAGVDEGTDVSFTVNLTRSGSEAANPQSVTVDWAITTDNSITNPVDPGDFTNSPNANTFPSGMLTFAANESSVSVAVPTTDDSAVESAETYIITLSNAQPGDRTELTPATITGEINASDQPAGPLRRLSIVQPEAVNEGGSVSFRVDVDREAGDTEASVSVDWAVAADGAPGANSAAAADFAGGAFPAGTLSIPLADSSATATFPAANDNTLENAETYTITLSNPSPAAGTELSVAAVTGLINTQTISAGEDREVFEGAEVTLTGTITGFDTSQSYEFCEVRGRDGRFTVASPLEPCDGTTTVPENGMVSITFTAPEQAVASSSTRYFGLGVADASTQTVVVIVNNDDPVANAGPDQTVVAGDTVTLDATGSTNRAGQANTELNYAWTQVRAATGGPADAPVANGVALSNANAANPTFTAPGVVATLHFKVTATDTVTNVEHADWVQITVQPPPPEVFAGDDQRGVVEGRTVTLSGRVTGSGTVNYTWAQVDGDGAVITTGPGHAGALSGATGQVMANVATASFTAPPQAQHSNHPNALTRTEYHFRLTGDDGRAATSDTVTVEVIDGVAPMVSVTPASQRVAEDSANNASLFSGSGTLAGVRLEFFWTQIDGPNPATANNIDSGDPGFVLFTTLTPAMPAVCATGQSCSVSTPSLTGVSIPDGQERTYYFRLTGVRSDNNEAGFAVTTVTVHDDDGTPTANAGADRTVAPGAAVTLDASASTDAAGTPGTASTANLTYAWLQVDGANSNTAQSPALTLTGGNTAGPSFTAPATTGDLYFRVVVTDGITGRTHAAWTTIAVRSDAPVVTVGPDRTLDEGSTPIALTGTVTRGEGDTTSDALTYEWVQVASAAPGAATVSGGPALDNGGSNTPQAGTGVSNAAFTVPDVDVPTAYYFVLVGQSGASRITTGPAVTITVRDTDPPVVDTLTITPAIAEGESAAELGTAQAAATASGPGTDPGLTYQWAQTSPDPAGSGNPVITIASPQALTTQLTYPDLEARTTQAFTLRFTVTDTQGLTRDRDITFTVRDITPPTARATAPQVNPGDTATLNASGSLNAAGAEGVGLAYAWTQITSLTDDAAPTGNVVALSDAAAANPTFDAPNSVTTLYFRVTVTDVVTLASDATRTTVRVDITPVPPTVDAGVNQTVDENSTVTLEGSVTAGRDPKTYQWTQVDADSPSASAVGSPIALTGATGTPSGGGSSTATFTAPEQTAGADYYFRLTGVAGAGTADAMTASDIVTVTVNDIQPPTVGSAITIDPEVEATGEPENTTATVSVTTAADPDGDTVTYQWSQVSPLSPAIMFGTPNAISTTLTYPELSTPRGTQEFTIRFTVSDSVGLSASTDISVTVHDTTAPTANAGDDFRADTGTEVVLNAGASRNAAGDAGGITWAWQQVDGANSNTAQSPALTLANANTAAPSFTAPATPSTLHFRVTVSDEVTLNSHADWVTVRVTNPPRTIIAPVVTAVTVQQVTDEVVTGANFQTNPAATTVTLRGFVTRGEGDDPANTLNYRWTQVNSAAADATEITSDMADYTTLTNPSGMPGTAGASDATFTPSRVADRMSGSPENYYFRLTGDSAEEGVDMAGASTVVTVSVYAPRGIVVTGGFPSLMVPESIGVIEVTFKRRHDWRQASGNIGFRGSIAGNRNNGAVREASVRPDNNLRHIRDFFVNDRLVSPASHSFDLSSSANTLVWRYTVVDDDNPEELEGVGFGYNFQCIVCTDNNYVLEPRLGIAHGLINDVVIQDDDTLTVGWSTSTFTVNEDDGMATLTAVIETPAAATERDDFTLQYATIAGGSAVAGTDYTAVAATDATFDVSESRVEVTVPIADNNLVETAGTVRTFLVQLSTATSTPLLTAIGRATATVTIVNDDFPPAVVGITPSRTSLTEGDGNDVDFDITLTGGPFNTAVTVDFAVTGTGITTDDYSITAPTGLGPAASAGTLTFNTDATDTAGSPQSDTVTLSISDDTLNEAAETLVLEVRTSIGAASQTSVTINDDDDRTVSLGVTPATPAEGGNAVFTATMSGAAADAVTLPLTITGSAASADYTLPGADPRQIVIAAGDTQATYSVAIAADNLNEAAETLEITLGAPAPGAGAGTITLGSPAAATATIQESDPITVSIARAGAAAINEGESAQFTVTLSGATDGSAADITVPYSPSGFTGEFTDTGGGMLVIAAGDTEGTITINTSNSASLGLTDPDQTLTVTLGASPTAGTGGGSVTRGTPNSAQVTVNFVDASHTLVLEGDNTIDEADTAATTTYTVRRSGPAVVSGQDLIINWAVVAGTAAAADFGGGSLPAGGTLTFSGSDATATFDIGIAGDNINEPDETFDIGFSIASANQAAATANSGVAVPSTRSVTINDDDPVEIAITRHSSCAASVAEGGDCRFDITLSGGTRPSGYPTINVFHTFTVDGDATAAVVNSDINRPDGNTLTGALVANLAQNQDTYSITARLRDDNLNEATETVILQSPVRSGVDFFFGTGGPRGVVQYAGGAASASASVDIADNDAITVSIANQGTDADGGLTGFQVEEAGSAVFRVTIDHRSASTVSVPFTIANLEDADVVGGLAAITASPLTISPGQTQADITIPLATDEDGSLDEPAETITVQLTADDSATPATNEGPAAAGAISVSATAGSASQDIIPRGAVRTLTVIGPAGINETDADVESGQYTIQISGDAFTRETVVTWTVTNVGTADADFTAASDRSGTVTFPANSPANQNFSLTVAGDNRNEAAEAFTVQVSVADPSTDSGTAFGAAHSTTINDDDDIEMRVTAAVSTVAESAGQTVRDVVFTVDLGATLSRGNADLPFFFGTESEAATAAGAAAGVGATIGARPADGLESSAAAGTDFYIESPTGLETTTRLPVANGQSGGQLTLRIVDDGLNEATEAIVVGFSSGFQSDVHRTIRTASGANTAIINRASNNPIPAAVVTITDDDPVEVSIDAARDVVNEGEDAEFNVILSAPSAAAISVPYTIGGDVTAPGSETDGDPVDYTDTSGGSISVAANSTMGSIEIAILSDRRMESTETMTVTLDSASGGTGAGTVSVASAARSGEGAGTGSLRRRDGTGPGSGPLASQNDRASVTIAQNTTSTRTLSVSGPPTLNEGDTGNYTVMLTGSAFTEATVVTWTATGADFTGTGQNTTPTATVQFGPSDGAGTTKSFTLDITDDNLNEARQTTMTVSLSVADSTTDDGTAFGSPQTTIVNDNDPITVTIADAGAVNEGDMAMFPVTLTGGVPTANVNLPYTLAATGVGGFEDWDSHNQEGSLSAGTTQGTIAVPIRNDTVNESTETLTLTLGTPRTAGEISGGGATATATIAQSDDIRLRIDCRIEPIDEGQRRACSFSDAGNVNRQGPIMIEWMAAVVTQTNLDTNPGSNTRTNADSDGERDLDAAETGASAAFSVDARDAGVITGTLTTPEFGSSSVSGNYGRFEIIAVQDGREESTETVTVSITRIVSQYEGAGRVSVSGNPNDRSSTFDIPPNLAAQRFVVFGSATMDGAEDSVVEIPVELTGIALESDVVVPVTAAAGAGGNPAEAGDYELLTRTLTFTNTGTQNVRLQINQDAVNESTETVLVTFGAITGGGGAGAIAQSPDSVTVSIAQSDPVTYSITAAPNPAPEDGEVTVTVGLSAQSEGDVSVALAATSGGSFGGRQGLLSGEFSGVPASVTVAAGASSTEFRVNLIDDSLVEADESFSVLPGNITRSAEAGAVTAAGGASIVRITDNDAAYYTITPVETSVAEGGDAQFNINLVRQSDDTAVTAPGNIVVPWSASVSQANRGDANTQAAPDLGGGAGAEGATLSGEATITAGQSMATITLSINSDQLAEDEETLTVTLGTPPTLTPETGVVQRSPTDSAQVTIPENTAATRILSVARITGAALNTPLYEQDASRDDTGADLYELVLSIPAGGTSSEAITVEWSVVAGEATANANPAEPADDFNVVSGTTTIPAGATDGATAIVALQLAEDMLNEGEESFAVEWELNPANPDVAAPLDTAGIIARSSSDTIALTRAVFSGSCTELSNGCSAPIINGSSGIDVTEDLRIFLTFDATGGVGGNSSWSVNAPSNEQTGASATLTLRPSDYNSVYAFQFQPSPAEDSFNEDTQTVVVRFTGAESAGDVTVDGIGGGTGRMDYSVTDNDPTTVMVADAPAATEGDSARFPVEFTGGIPTRDVEIDWEVVLTGATAEAEDFDRLTGTETIRIAFPTGLSDAVTTGIVRVPIAMDDDDEEDRFILSLTAARGAGGSGISVATGAASTAMAIINRLDLSPPRFADSDAQPGWTGGQQVLWVKLNENFKVLPSPAGETASSDTAISLTTLNAGDFTVVDNHGTPSSATIAVTGATPFPDEADPALRLTLASAITADGADGQDGATVGVYYEHSGGNAIYDLAVERELAFEGRRNRMQSGMVVLMARDTNTTADADGDGIPDAAEARISGDAGNPFAAVADTQQPAFRFIRASNRGPAPTRSPVAYSGIREHGVRDHLGVLSMTSTTQTAAQTITAYYRSDTFGYDGTYACATGQFPVNYDAPLAEGGCAPVDWGNIAPSTNHTIAWLARSADGVWKTDLGSTSVSNLPEQVIYRIPELNMDAQSRFTTGTVVITASLDAAPGETPLTLTLTRAPVGGSATEITTDGGQMFAVTRTSAESAEWEIAGLANSGGASRLYRPGTNTSVYPASNQYSLGLVRQTRVTRINVAVPPLLERAWLAFSTVPNQATHVLRDGQGQNLYVVVENNDDIGPGGSVMLSDNGVLNSNLPQNFLSGISAYPITLNVNDAASSVTDTAVFQVTVTGGFGGVTTATYRFPVRPGSHPLAQTAVSGRDSDDDGIIDDIDAFDNSDHLPVVVDEEAGASAWHHIRPALPVHDLRLGEATAERLSSATAVEQVDDYAEYSASSVPEAEAGLAVVYDFEIGGVDYAEVTTEGRTGGEAGVIIPLPRDLYAGGASLVKYPANVPFSVEGENDYGFATLQDDGACPDDTMEAGSPYREGETLRRAKRGGDACLVVYIVDGGPNDEDGVANGIIKDPLGIRATALGGSGSRSHSGAFGPPALTALAALLLLMLALSLKTPRRAPPRRRA